MSESDYENRRLIEAARKRRAEALEDWKTCLNSIDDARRFFTELRTLCGLSHEATLEIEFLAGVSEYQECCEAIDDMLQNLQRVRAAFVRARDHVMIREERELEGGA